MYCITPCLDSADPNALITVEVLLVSPSCPTLEDKEHLKIVNVQFNSLDIIANQETIIELIGFSRRVFPENPSARNESLADLVEQEPVYPDQPSEPGTGSCHCKQCFLIMHFAKHNVDVVQCTLYRGVYVLVKIIQPPLSR